MAKNDKRLSDLEKKIRPNEPMYYTIKHPGNENYRREEIDAIKAKVEAANPDHEVHFIIVERAGNE
jgi:hypothetical protein